MNPWRKKITMKSNPVLRKRQWIYQSVAQLASLMLCLGLVDQTDQVDPALG